MMKIKKQTVNRSSPAVYIISGPGGVGKTTVVKRLFLRKNIKDNFIKSISYTTRKKRVRERDGKDYFFVGKDEFLNLKKKKFFLESEKVLEDYYGTPKSLYAWAKQGGKKIVLCIDVKGGMYLKNNLKRGRIITIFIAAPSENDLQRRLGGRQERKEFIEKRIDLGKKEEEFSNRYDFCVVNKDLKTTVDKVAAILLEKS